MAFGGVQENEIKGANGPYKNWIHIEGLLLANATGPFDLTNPGVGALTTSANPLPGENQIPPTWGRGPGKWLFQDPTSIVINFLPIFDPVQVAGVVPFPLQGHQPTFLPSGDLLFTFVNIQGLPPGVSCECHFGFLFLHTLIQ